MSWSNLTISEILSCSTTYYFNNYFQQAIHGIDPKIKMANILHQNTHENNWLNRNCPKLLSTHQHIFKEIDKNVVCLFLYLLTKIYFRQQVYSVLATSNKLFLSFLRPFWQLFSLKVLCLYHHVLEKIQNHKPEAFVFLDHSSTQICMCLKVMTH